MHLPRGASSQNFLTNASKSLYESVIQVSVKQVSKRWFVHLKTIPPIKKGSLCLHTLKWHLFVKLEFGTGICSNLTSNQHFSSTFWGFVGQIEPFSFWEAIFGSLPPATGFHEVPKTSVRKLDRENNRNCDREKTAKKINSQNMKLNLPFVFGSRINTSLHTHAIKLLV